MTTYPDAPTTFEEVIKLIPRQGKIDRHRFKLGDKPFELTIGRNDMNMVFLEFGVPNTHFEFFSTTRTVDSLASQRQIRSVWENFLADPDDYLTWKRFEVKIQR
jgi:hypothetical protein